MRRILGIDPGSRITGYGVIASDGSRSTHITSGCIRVSDEEFPVRLGKIFQRLSEIVTEFQPVEMAVEQVFVSNNPSSALKLGQARGAAICAGVVAGLPVSEYTPRMVKLSLVGTGGADKQQVQHMVARILNLHERLALDQTDALAVALSHAHSTHTKYRIARQSEGWQR